MEDNNKNTNTNGEVTQDDQNNAANEGNNNTNDNSNTNDNNSGNGSTEKTFTQSEVNKMMSKEKHQGANSVYNELGIKPGDKKAVASIKEFLASQKSDEQKALEAEQQKAHEIAEAEQRAILAEAKAEAMMIGVQTQFVEDAVTLALAKVAAEDGTTIQSALGELKSKYPVWFGTSGDNEDDKDKQNNAGQKGTGSSVKSLNKDNNDKNASSLGARLAASKKSSQKKSTYWGASK